MMKRYALIFFFGCAFFIATTGYAASVRDTNNCNAHCFALNYGDNLCMDVCSVMMINVFEDMKKADKCMAHCMAVNNRSDAFNSCLAICSVFGKVGMPKGMK